MDENWTKNGQKNDQKMDENWTKNGQKNDQKMTLKGSKIDLKIT